MINYAYNLFDPLTKLYRGSHNRRRIRAMDGVWEQAGAALCRRRRLHQFSLSTPRFYFALTCLTLICSVDTLILYSPIIQSHPDSPRFYFLLICLTPICSGPTPILLSPLLLTPICSMTPRFYFPLACLTLICFIATPILLSPCLSHPDFIATLICHPHLLHWHPDFISLLQICPYFHLKSDHPDFTPRFSCHPDFTPRFS